MKPWEKILMGVVIALTVCIVIVTIIDVVYTLTRVSWLQSLIK